MRFFTFPFSYSTATAKNLAIRQPGVAVNYYFIGLRPATATSYSWGDEGRERERKKERDRQRDRIRCWKTGRENPVSAASDLLWSRWKKKVNATWIRTTSLKEDKPRLVTSVQALLSANRMGTNEKTPSTK